MDSATKSKNKDISNTLECLVNGDLKGALDKAKEWSVNNPIPAGKSPLS